MEFGLHLSLRNGSLPSVVRQADAELGSRIREMAGSDIDRTKEYYLLKSSADVEGPGLDPADLFRLLREGTFASTQFPHGLFAPDEVTVEFLEVHRNDLTAAWGGAVERGEMNRDLLDLFMGQQDVEYALD